MLIYTDQIIRVLQFSTVAGCLVLASSCLAPTPRVPSGRDDVKGIGNRNYVQTVDLKEDGATCFIVMDHDMPRGISCVKNTTTPE